MWLSATALSTSTCLSTMTGLLPPSSRVQGLMCSAAMRPTMRPTSVLPVKATLSTSLWPASGAPASGPQPVMMLSTPGGSPASRASCPSLRAVMGVCSASLSTTVLPHARAGASFQAAMSRGKFQGMICAATPRGSWKVCAQKGPSTGMVRPWILSAHPAKYLKWSTDSGTSAAREEARGLPLSRVSSTASSSACCSIRSASL
mmetsp:Transcript_11613/g.24915  ORF Transcript_11613/g.24915 Transcript_11613/m.24915 type:complete len:203 (+) Transcript_11613:250-858(+)